MSRTKGVLNSNGLKVHLLTCLPGTLDEIEKKMKKEFPNVSRSTIRGRISELRADKRVVRAKNEYGEPIFHRTFGVAL